MTQSLRSQRPRASRCSLPPSLYLKTQGRWSSREAGEGWGQGVRHAYPAHPRWPSSHPRPGPRSLLGEVPVYVHVGLFNVADKGRGRLAVRVQQDGHGLFPV